ncbi:MAG: aminoacyl-tRNA hydrolase [Gammaproteobacteria bacterium]|nr:aminoacyl-tRNA hydrolase [Gammaproteobacteria bacterium]
MPESFQLVVGLGNPGPEYSATRHNAGFWCVDRIADRYNLQFRSDAKFSGELARLSSQGLDCWLLKPATFMNDSGRSIQALLAYYRIAVERMLVIHDEIDLPPGTVRLKTGGGHGGHNGLRDIIEKIGSNAFSRVRIGVGHPGSKDQVVSSVLGRASAEDQKLIDESIDDVLQLMPGIIQGQLQKAMTILHTKEKLQDDPGDDD